MGNYPVPSSTPEGVSELEIGIGVTVYTIYEIGSLLYTAILINVVSILKVDKNVKVPLFFP